MAPPRITKPSLRDFPIYTKSKKSTPFGLSPLHYGLPKIPAIAWRLEVLLIEALHLSAVFGLLFFCAAEVLQRRGSKASGRAYLCYLFDAAFPSLVAVINLGYFLSMGQLDPPVFVHKFVFRMAVYQCWINTALYFSSRLVYFLADLPQQLANPALPPIFSFIAYLIIPWTTFTVWLLNIQQSWAQRVIPFFVEIIILGFVYYGRYKLRKPCITALTSQGTMLKLGIDTVLCVTLILFLRIMFFENSFFITTKNWKYIFAMFNLVFPVYVLYKRQYYLSTLARFFRCRHTVRSDVEKQGFSKGGVPGNEGGRGGMEGGISGGTGGIGVSNEAFFSLSTAGKLTKRLGGTAWEIIAGRDEPVEKPTVWNNPLTKKIDAGMMAGKKNKVRLPVGGSSKTGKNPGNASRSDQSSNDTPSGARSGRNSTKYRSDSARSNSTTSTGRVNENISIEHLVRGYSDDEYSSYGMHSGWSTPSGTAPSECSEAVDKDLTAPGVFHERHEQIVAEHAVPMLPIAHQSNVSPGAHLRQAKRRMVGPEADRKKRLSTSFDLLANAEESDESARTEGV